jgi:putative pyruvate formate lyase activating enzyme
MRYNDNNVAKIYSGCEKYTDISRTAVKEMFRQVGNLEFKENMLAKSGLIVRHLVLPGNISGSEGIFRYLAKEVSPDVYISMMSQYFPAYKAVDDETINRQISTDEFRLAVDAFYEVGLRNGYIQNTEYETI